MIIIGENLHCSRVLKAGGPRCAKGADGSLRISWQDATGAGHGFAVPAELAGDKVKHVIAAVRVARSGGAEFATALEYLAWIVRRQEAAGAAFLDVNVDEFSPDKERNADVMRWLVAQAAGWTRLPLSLDSSSSAVLAAGAESATRAGVKLLFNSASMERLEVLDLAAAAGAAVLCSAAGAAVMPRNAAERVAALEPVVAAAQAKGLGLDRLFLDPLVLPVGVDSTQGAAYLDACRELRRHYGSAVHITGGISNVSFGMPERRLLNHTFLELAQAAGLDAAIYDPLQLAPLAWSGEWKQAAARVLTGADAFAVEFLALVRGGE